MLTRRVFLKNSALAIYGVGSAPTWLSRAVCAAEPQRSRKKIFIVIFQRGAVDGLNVVVPYGDPEYYRLRPGIAIPRPNGRETSAIDLDGHFGLHPALRSLKALWDQRQLAIVEAVGSPDPTRSHFEAQDYMESGSPGLKTISSGWLNRALRREPRVSPVRAVSLTPDLPLTLRGENEALAIANINDFRIRDVNMAASFETMYRESTDPVLKSTARETFEAVKIMQSLGRSAYTPADGARYPGSRLGRSLSEIARLIKADVGLEVAFTDVGGWDTHLNEVAAEPHTGHLANLLADFGESLATFSQDMGARMTDITIATMSEFGRTAQENGNRGTDHGHANVMFVLGGGARGGKVYGDWPGLAREQLYEGRDLNVTTDFRTVLSELVTKQMGNQSVEDIFPGFHSRESREIVSV